IVDKCAIAAVAANGDDAVGDQFRPTHLLARRQWMIVAARKHEWVFNQFLEFNFGMRGADEIDAEIGFSARHRLQPFVGADIQNPDANARIGRGEPADRARQEVEYRGRHGGDRNQPRPARSEVMDAEHRRLELVDEAAYLWQEVAADHGEIDVAR